PLVVRAGAQDLGVRFVDPDPPEAAERETDLESAESLDLRSLALSGRRDDRAARFLLDELGPIRSTGEGELRPRKDAALAAMQVPGFWEDDARHDVLAEAEYLDRLDAAYATAVKLGERLPPHVGGRRPGGARGS